MNFFKKSNFIVAIALILTCLQLSYADTSYKVKASDTMDKISKMYYQDSKLSKHQIYIGILAENPTAFRLGNINYLKTGQLLNLPDPANLLAMEKTDATKLVARHNFNANKGNKTNIAPPFEGYSPKTKLKNSNDNDVNLLTEKQQNASEKLKSLNSETETLRLRLEQLNADKEAMDAELLQLNNLLKK